METVQYLLSKFTIAIIALSVVVFFYWLGTILFPFLPKTMSLAKETQATSTQKEDLEFFLPTPGSLSLKGAEQSEYPYGRPLTDEDFFTYDGINQAPVWPVSDKPVTASGYGSASDFQVFDPMRSGFSQIPYVRSLSLYKNAKVYGGLQFSGEAKESMFANGMFSIYVVSPQGKVVGRGEGRISDEGARLEWRKFIGRITTPISIKASQCSLLFEQQRPNGVKVYFPVSCN